MIYKKSIDLLCHEFPDISAELENHFELSGLPHCVFDILFVPYILKISSKKDVQELKKIGNFLEQMAVSSDSNVRELLNVSVLEPLIQSKESAIEILKAYLGENTQKEMQYWEKDRGTVLPS